MTNISGDNYEQRIRTLEEQTSKLMKALEQQSKSKGLNKTRRQALAGVLGGATLLGVTGKASAQSNINSKVSSTCTCEDNKEKIEDLQNRTSELSLDGSNYHGDEVSTEELNSIITISTDDDLAARLSNLGNRAGCLVVLSKGTHVVDQTVSVPDFIEIEGTGVESTYIESSGDFPVFDLNELPDANWHRSRFANFTIRNGASGMGDADLLTAYSSHNLRMNNVYFDGSNTTGNSIYAHECWDWKLHQCFFIDPGNETEKTAGIYLYNGDNDSSNAFHVTDCRFEPIQGYAVYSDNSGNGTSNGRCIFTGCKFHGESDAADRSSLPHISGDWIGLQISNGFHIWHDGPYLDITGSRNIITGVNFRDQGVGDAINLESDRTTVSGCYISDRIVVTGTNTQISGCFVYDKGIRTEGEHCSITANTVRAGGNIEAAGWHSVISSNEVHASDSPAIDVSSQHCLIAANNISDPNNTSFNISGASRGCLVVGNMTRLGDGHSVASSRSDNLVVVANRFDDDLGLDLSGTNNEVGFNIEL